VTVDRPVVGTPGIRNEDARIRSNLFVSDWHYRSFGPDADALDIDLFGRCRACYRILYAIEATADPGKHVEFTKQVAGMLGARPILFLHDDAAASVLEIRDLRSGRRGDEEYGKDLVSDLRLSHADHCRKAPPW
jgi:hypothetical protein